jgi:anti-sigma regulatory factor (Ser/Thr protein kinase)
VPEETVRTRHLTGSPAGTPEAALVLPVRRHRRFPHHETSVSAARTFAHEVLTGWGVTERLDDLRLCLSEVATNALLHARAAARGFEVCLTFDQDAVLLEVHDDGGGRPARQDPAAEDGNGRGLLLVDALADSWGVRDEPTGKTVWLFFRLTGLPGGPGAGLPGGPVAGLPGGPGADLPAGPGVANRSRENRLPR